MVERYHIQWENTTKGRQWHGGKYFKTYNGAVGFYNRKREQRSLTFIVMFDTFESPHVMKWKELRTWTYPYKHQLRVLKEGW